jgi:hypothetical protein
MTVPLVSANISSSRLFNSLLFDIDTVHLPIEPSSGLPAALIGDGFCAGAIFDKDGGPSGKSISKVFLLNRMVANTIRSNPDGLTKHDGHQFGLVILAFDVFIVHSN